VALLAAFSIGVLVDWALHKYGPPLPASALEAPGEAHAEAAPRRGAAARNTAATNSADRPAADSAPLDTAPVEPPGGRMVSTIGTGKLRVPIDDANVESFKGGFAERRGERAHEAVDILAPRNTPIHAVEAGSIAKLFVSKQGGLTIYQFDPTGRICYYYAHLERYAPGLHEGDIVSQGQIIGYVGTTGNAPPNTPHLHLAVFEVGEDHKWWKGRAIDPYLVFRGRAIEVHTH
jgi:murein DD-endopeptidase MepM/ murein hydrolase activator NlpD